MSSSIDLRTENILRFSSQVPGLNLIIKDMESVESWVASSGTDKGFSENLRLTMFSLNDKQLRNMGEKKHELLWILFFLPTAVSFYLLDCLANALEEMQSMMLEYAIGVMNDPGVTDKRHAQVFIDRCTHLNSGNFLQTITNESFTRTLLGSIQTVKERSGDVY